MTVKLLEETKKLDLVDLIGVPNNLQDYLTTYHRQYNEMVETYAWMESRLNASQKPDWKRTIQGLLTICMALDAGFSPVTPPKNWSSGQLFQYIAPIPEEVREKINIAETIFSKQQMLIYDPNSDHFQRPKVIDPLVVGFVDLASLRHHFLIGQWDLAADLSFLENGESVRSMERSSRNVEGLVRILKNRPTDQDSLPSIPDHKSPPSSPYRRVMWEGKWNQLVMGTPKPPTFRKSLTTGGRRSLTETPHGGLLSQSVMSSLVDSQKAKSWVASMMPTS